MQILLLVFFCVFVIDLFSLPKGSLLLSQQEVFAQGVEEKEIFINIHSGLKTIPVRKVIEYVIEEAEQNGIVEIDGEARHTGGGMWSITVKFLKGKNPHVLKWLYGREKWDLQPLDETTKLYSFPLDNYIIGPAINMSLDTIESKGIEVERVFGRGVKLPSGPWQFSLNVNDPQGNLYVQEWLYDWKHKELTPQHFDHSDLDKVLAVCVTDDGVDYSILKKDANLEEFLKRASKMDKLELAALSREEQIAFWIDVYNATVIKRVADKFPVKSVREIKGFFDKEQLKAAGKKLTLDEIRNHLLEDFKEKRVIFALVSGTRSSPPLRREAYCGRLLEGQLEDALIFFLNDPANLYVTKAGILLSPALEPLEREGTLRDFLKNVSNSLPQDVSKALLDKKKEIKFIEYDWALNSAE